MNNEQKRKTKKKHVQNWFTVCCAVSFSLSLPLFLPHSIAHTFFSYGDAVGPIIAMSFSFRFISKKKQPLFFSLSFRVLFQWWTYCLKNEHGLSAIFHWNNFERNGIVVVGSFCSHLHCERSEGRNNQPIQLNGKKKAKKKSCIWNSSVQRELVTEIRSIDKVRIMRVCVWQKCKSHTVIRNEKKIP